MQIHQMLPHRHPDGLSSVAILQYGGVHEQCTHLLKIQPQHPAPAHPHPRTTSYTRELLASAAMTQPAEPPQQPPPNHHLFHARAQRASPARKVEWSNGYDCTYPDAKCTPTPTPAFSTSA